MDKVESKAAVRFGGEVRWFFTPWGAQKKRYFAYRGRQVLNSPIMSPLSCPSVFQPLQVDDGHYRNDRKDDGRHFKILSFSFLNTDYDLPIIHEDITSSNILLDGSFCARIADFGLASFKSDVDLMAEVLDV
ncbi:hypothetical protein SUGI_1123160 [Cryptomeria japonica]|nr:hypothetical protein SUGI_1123160 [Cryptomeria japonica]